MDELTRINGEGTKFLEEGDLARALHAFDRALGMIIKYQKSILVTQPSQTSQHQHYMSRISHELNVTDVAGPQGDDSAALHHHVHNAEGPIWSSSLRNGNPPIESEQQESCFFVFGRAANVRLSQSRGLLLDVHEVCTVIMFNVAVVQHLFGLRNRKASLLRSSNGFMRRAVGLYICVLKSCLFQMQLGYHQQQQAQQQLSDSARNGEYHQEYVLLTVYLATLNNLGQIHAEIFGDSPMGASYFQRLYVTLELFHRAGIPSQTLLKCEEHVGLMLNGIAFQSRIQTAVAA